MTVTVCKTAPRLDVSGKTEPIHIKNETGVLHGDQVLSRIAKTTNLFEPVTFKLLVRMNPFT